jgi:hypothetical protein
MNVNGTIGMYNLIRTMGLIDKNPQTRGFIDCVLSIQGCACTARDEKLRRKQHCNKLYVELARWASSNMVHDFLSKTSERQISFYTDSGDLIIIMSR